MYVIIALLLLVGCEEAPPPPPPPPPPPLTQAQRVWVRDVCVPNTVRGGMWPDTAVGYCRKAAREVVNDEGGS